MARPFATTLIRVHGLAGAAATVLVLAVLATSPDASAKRGKCVLKTAAGGAPVGVLRGTRIPRPRDRDADGLTNAKERRLGTRANRPDTDADGLSDGYEVRCSGSSPTRADTDGDGVKDGLEIQAGTDPLTAPQAPEPTPLRPPTSTPTPPPIPTPPPVAPPDPETPEPPPVAVLHDLDEDGLDNELEVSLGTDPLNPDTDSDGIWDGDEIEIEENPKVATEAEVIYVSPSGSRAGNGTKRSPGSFPELLPRLAGGELVLLEPGDYGTAGGRILDSLRRRQSEVELVGLGDEVGMARVFGLELWGSTDLTFRRLGFDRVIITDDPGHRGPEFASARIRLDGNVFSKPGGTCLTMRSGAHDLLVENNLFHRCKTAINGPNTGEDPKFDSHRISIINNKLTDLDADGIQFGRWHEVLIHGNEIGPIGPSKTHNDAIQFTGGSRHVVISANHLHDSANQLLLIQPAFGPISDVLVVNNLINDAGSIAVQSQGIDGARFINNTIWNSNVNGLLIRTYGDVVPVGNVVANNILYGFSGPTEVMTNNLVRTDKTLPPHNLVIGLNGDPGFANAGAGDFSLRPESVARAAGSAAYAPEGDLLGLRRSLFNPSVGAYE